MAELVSLLPIIGIGLLFWLLIIRPQSRRQKALAKLQSELVPGNEVMLSAGVFGVVERLADDRVHVRIAEGVTVEVARGAIANVAQPVEPTDNTEHTESTGPTDPEQTPGQ